MSAQTASAQTLTFGGDPSGGAPYLYNNPSNPAEYIGFDLEIAEAIGKELGLTARLIPTDWESIVASLNRNSFRVIIDGFEPTKDREKDVLFSKPYFLFRLQLTSRLNDVRITTIEDCKNKKLLVGTLVNCAASRYLEREQIPFRSYPDPVGAYSDLEYGRLDAVLMDIPMERFYASANPKFERKGEPFHTGAYVVGLRKNDTLFVKDINRAIDSIINRGDVEKIFRKYDLWDSLQYSLKTHNASFEITEKKFNWREGLLKLAEAAGVTILLAFGAMLIAVFLGLPLAMAQMSNSKILSSAATVYIEFFRGTPVLVQLLFLYFGLPYLGITLPGWLTAMVGLGLNYSAYESQVYRTAFQSIPEGQWNVAYTLGMSPVLTFRRIILPQAFRVALPPMTNDFVALFKDTSTAFAISVWELATAYRELANATQGYLLLGAIVCLFYLAMSLPLAYFARRLEKKLNPSLTRQEDK